ncbi:carboxymuconolactone decarboxylase [Sphingobacteriaceae bacterium GW460-11-11-14-LB5]|nr:carboxymuconolactone decarboxylase [Sphingobacteriaceae bacterium GW460-11-11-14-LB5]
MKLFNINLLTLVLGVTLSLPANLMAQSSNAKSTLSAKQQNLIAIAGLTAKGDLPALKVKLNAGLDAALTINETKETMVHLYAYCGFPRSIRGLQTLMAVLEERKAKGIADQRGAEPSPVNDNRTKYERGKEILGKLTGASQDGPRTGYAAFASEIEVFLKEHLFADIFERDVLTYAERELVTVAVLSSIGGAEPMLNSHLSICLNVGLSPGQLQQFVGVIAQSIGKKEADAAQVVLNEVLKSKK